MLSTKDKGTLIQIGKRCERILDKTQNINKDVFDHSDDLKEVICFNLFQIGELAHNLSKDFTNDYNGIPWKQIINMRNKIVHRYVTVEFDVVWNTAINDIPALKDYCKKILDENQTISS